MAKSDSSPAEPDDDSTVEGQRLDAELRCVEEMLAKLRPTQPRSTFRRRLQAWLTGVQRRGSGAAIDGACLFGNHPVLSAAERRRRRWSRVVPVGIAALVVLSGAVLFHQLATLPPVGDAAKFSAPVEAGDGGSIDSSFEVVSAESSLREIEEDEIVLVDGLGPMRPVTLHYEAAQCWLDPHSQTSVQVIVPWQEVIFYPVSTY